MKKLRSLASVLLAMVMALALSVTVFAASGSSTITITGVPTATHTFTAYQIFSGDVSGNTLSNVQWGDGVTSGSAALAAAQSVTADNSTYPFASCSSAADVAEVLAGYSSDSDLVKAFAEAMSAVLSSTSSGSTNSGTASGSTYTYEISGVATGYYLVTDSTSTTQGDAVSAYVLYVAGGTSSIAFKNEVPTPTKEIVDGSSTYGTSAGADETVTFKITGTIPGYAADYDSYTYIFRDTMSSNLSNATNFAVSASTSGTLAETTNYTVSTIGQNITITILNAKTYAGEIITVTYDATLDSGAAAGTAETNTVYIEYSNNPNGSGTGTTVEKKVYVYTFDLTVDKVDDSGNALSGAGFTLYKKADITAFESGITYYTYANNTMEAVASGATYDSSTDYYTLVDTETVTANGSKYTATFNDLGEGDYILVETTTPSGYNTVTPVSFTISATYNTDGTISSLSGSGSVSAGTSLTTLTTEIENKSGASMPTTGGIGTTIFYIVGGVLVLGAVVLLITRRRMRKA
ncbi:MAG: SpaH/EbpB family LPXTG-anchored major pilin [Lachnospiraceae bacterium]|nr:SpaH/EbpB family LPXTG-anchored major pilin [Lachnospiraceae bacterium]